MLTFQQRRENLKRLSDAPRRRREVRAVACEALDLLYGPAECLPSEAEGHLAVDDGYFSQTVVPVAWKITNNRGVLVQRGA